MLRLLSLLERKEFIVDNIVNHLSQDLSEAYERSPFDKVEPFALLFIQYLGRCVSAISVEDPDQYKKCIESYMDSLITFCRVARQHNQPKITMIMIMQAEKTLEHAEIPVKHFEVRLLLEEARTLWHHGAESTAYLKLDQLIQLSDPPTRQARLSSSEQMVKILHEEVIIQCLCQAGNGVLRIIPFDLLS